MENKIKGIRMTKEGHALFEFRKGAEASRAADTMKKKIEERLPDRVGTVHRLGQLVEVEIVGIDPTATKDEVRMALRTAIPETHPNKAAGHALEITGI